MTDQPTTRRVYQRPPADWTSMTEAEKEAWAASFVDALGAFPPDANNPAEEPAAASEGDL